MRRKRKQKLTDERPRTQLRVFQAHLAGRIRFFPSTVDEGMLLGPEEPIRAATIRRSGILVRATLVA